MKKQLLYVGSFIIIITIVMPFVTDDILAQVQLDSANTVDTVKETTTDETDISSSDNAGTNTTNVVEQKETETDRSVQFIEDTSIKIEDEEDNSDTSSSVQSSASEKDDPANLRVQAIDQDSTPIRVEPTLTPVVETEEERIIIETQVDVQQEKLLERSVLDAQRDSDGDGITDYDEINIYGTDPDNATTTGDGLSDAEKILQGINPITDEPISYEDPRETGEERPEKYSVSTVESVALEVAVIPTGTTTSETQVVQGTRFEGTGPANSFVTLYIFSTPIVVTVKTDDSGTWEYTHTEELSTGDHKIFVATVNNSGKILAKSTPIPFTRTAEASTLAAQTVQTETPNNSFSTTVFFSLLAAVLIAFLIIVVFIVGIKQNKHDEEQANIDSL